MVNHDQSRAQELAEVGRKVLAFYKELDPTADFSACESHRRNTENDLAGRHFQAAIRNAERVIDSVVAIFVRQVDRAVEQHPELEFGLTKLRFRANGLVYKLTRPDTEIEFVGGLRSLVNDFNHEFASATPRSTKAIPQRGRARREKRRNRGSGSHKRYRA